MIIRNSVLKDVEVIWLLLNSNKDDVSLFQQSEKEIRKNIDDFMLAEINGTAVGCIAIHVDKNSIAELLALSVLEQCQQQRIGKGLITECIKIATKNKIELIWLATAKPSYFLQFGFHPISKWSLPHYVIRRKLRLVFQQPITRWIPALFGRHTFMKYDSSSHIRNVRGV